MARAGAELHRDLRVIGLVSFGHMLSHFYFLVIPPILPLLKAEFGVSYAALGLLMTGFAVAAGMVQTPIGFLVDRIGARKVLIWGLAMESAAIGAIGLAQSFWQILLLYTLAGMFNTVFHPADYAILSGSVTRERLGRAFGFHLFSGNLGWALTPAVMVTLASLWDWRTAFFVIGAVGVIHACFLGTRMSLLVEERQAKPDERKANAPGHGVADGIRLLLSLPILMCLLFFIMLTLGFTGVRTFFVAASGLLHETPLETANIALTAFLAGSALGILAGGMLADRLGPRIGTAVATLVTAGALMAALGFWRLTPLPLIAALALSGVLQGLLLPTRDLLIRAVTPEGSMGKVMGFLTSGMMLASGLVPVLFGWLLDIGQPAWVFWLSGIFVIGALFSFSTARGRAVVR